MSDLIQNAEDIRLTDRDEIEAIMGHPPGWMLRSGNVGIMAFIILILIGGFYYKYPDVVQTRVELMSDSPPVRLASLESGRMVFLTKQDSVEVGDLIAVLENPAKLDDIQYLKEELEKISERLMEDDVPQSLTGERLELGALQADFGELNHWLDAYARFIKRDKTSGRIRNLKKQIKGMVKLNQELDRDENTLQQMFDAESEKYNRALILRDSGYISKEDFNNAEISYFQSKKDLESIESNIYTNEIQSEVLENQILELKENRLTKIDDSYLKATATLQKLKGGIKNWEQRYLVKSPIAGQLYMPNILNENQLLVAGKEEFIVIPTHQNIYGRAKVGQENFGKIKLDAVVKLRLLGFPYQDFGAVDGRVAEIDPLPENDLYGIRIEIPEENIVWENDKLFLISTFGKRLKVEQEMLGTGNVITKKRTFLERVFSKLRATWDE